MYYEEYRAHTSEASAQLEDAEGTAHRADRRAAAVAAERSIDAATEAVEMLEMESEALPKAQRATVTTRARVYRSQLSELGKRLKSVIRSDVRTTDIADADPIRKELFAGREDDDETNENSRMLANSDRLAAGNHKLRSAHAATVDIEERGALIMGPRPPPLVLESHGVHWPMLHITVIWLVDVECFVFLLCRR